MARRITIKSPWQYKIEGSRFEKVTFEEGSALVRKTHRKADSDLIDEVWQRDVYKIKELTEKVKIKTIVDVGAHIGIFSRFVKSLIPDAQVFSYECNPDNYTVLRKNVEPDNISIPWRAAVTYEKNLHLLNTVFDGTSNTGGSTLTSDRKFDNSTYWLDERPIVTKTLEDVFSDNNIETIDLLKLDCEGSELSILKNAQCLDRVKTIVGEWHNRDEFLDLMRHFGAWDFRILQDGKLGLFWLIEK